jgi:uncharacterized membrane protein YkvA (DUF1232 family)
MNASDELNHHATRASDTSNEAAHRNPVAEIGQKLRSLWSLMLDPAATPRSRVIAFLALGYLVSPYDLGFPDTWPLVGYLDDAAIIVLVLKYLADDLKRYLDRSA